MALPSITDHFSGYLYGSCGAAAEVPEPIDLSVLPEIDRFDSIDDWSYATDRIKPDPIISVPIPKSEPVHDAFLPEIENSLTFPPPSFWYQGPSMSMASYQPNQHPHLSQPPTPAAECQVSSTITCTSPYSPQSDVSFDDSASSPFEPQDMMSLEELNVKGLTEEQLVSLSARDLNRLCRDMPEDIIKQLKKRRRTLKNRGYAYNSRVRRVSQKNVLEKERDDLRKQLSQMSERCRFLERELEQWKMRAQTLERGEM